MRPIRELPLDLCARLQGVLCDIDDTLTWEGKLVPEAFLALRDLREAGLKVVPVTGRPGGWVDQIARMWPVDGVVGENGGLWFWLDEARGSMVRRFAQDEDTRRRNRERLDDLASRILLRVPGSKLASDQSYRDLDLAVDFCEDVDPLPESAIDTIVSEFRAAGATCKVSSIHVNGWFGRYDKLGMTRTLLAEAFGIDLDARRGDFVFAGDSPNDAPMFAFFPLAVGMANVRAFLDRIPTPPAYVTTAESGAGFVELAEFLLTA